jgi:hypothetical protein
MQYRILFALALLCLSMVRCASGETTPKATPPASTQQVKPSLASFTDTLQQLNSKAPAGIDSAVRLYDLLAPSDSTGADSAASALLRFIHDVVSNQNNQLQHDSTDYASLVYQSGQPLTPKEKALSSLLHQNKLKLVGDGEGGVYAVPLYETILPTLKAKTSLPVDNFLDLTAKEDTTPTFLDAGLAIEMTELVDRLMMSEQLLSQTLPKSFAADVAGLNQFYTNALIRGADNSPAFDNSTATITEDFKKGYDYLLSKYPGSKAAAKINVWLAVVASGDRKKIDDYLRLLP